MRLVNTCKTLLFLDTSQSVLLSLATCLVQLYNSKWRCDAPQQWSCWCSTSFWTNRSLAIIPNHGGKAYFLNRALNAPFLTSCPRRDSLKKSALISTVWLAVMLVLKGAHVGSLRFWLCGFSVKREDRHARSSLWLLLIFRRVPVSCLENTVGRNWKPMGFSNDPARQLFSANGFVGMSRRIKKRKSQVSTLKMVRPFVVVLIL